MTSTPDQRPGIQARPGALLRGGGKHKMVVVVNDGKLARFIGKQMLLNNDPQRPARKALTAGYSATKRKASRKSIPGFRPRQNRRAQTTEREEAPKTWHLLTEDMTVEADEHAVDEPEENVGISLPMTTTQQVKRRDDLIAYGEAKLAALRARTS